MISRGALASGAVVVLVALVPAAVPDAGSQRPGPASAGPGVATSELKEMRWRMIGPHRAGRGKAAVGIPDRPNVFFIGFHNGGVWKTTDYGRTWVPIFDDQPTGSIGAIAIAPSNADIIYVGSGEGNQRPDLATGDGIYRSSDGGKTWTHHGLRDAQQIPQIIVDPRNPDRIFVAALGHPYGANPERGIFRSTDGGRSFEKVLYKDENTGAADVAFDPKNPDVVYATLWESRQAPWENGVFTGPGSGLYKSIDGGTTWRPIGNGLPAGTDGLGRIGLGMCDAQPSRIYAIIASPPKLGGVYRSDDGGENWRRVNDDNRLWGRDGDFHEIKPDPTNCDVLYVANIASWKSTDGGKTFTDFRGAPGGDDYQRIWVNPKNTDIIIMIADQGAVITVNGGETWSSWYNQPTAQFYHVSTDNAFPYRVCGGQQESGSACVSSRGDDGQRDVPRMAPGRRRRIRLRRRGSARSRHRVRRQGLAVRPPHGSGSERRTVAARIRARRCKVRLSADPARIGSLSRRPHDARAVLADRSENAVLRVERRVENDDRREELDADQPRPHAPDLGRAAERRQVHQDRGRQADPARRRLYDRPVAARHQSHLGGNRRWADSRHDRRRQDMERRDSAGAEALGEGLADGRVALRRAHGVHRDQHFPARRSQAAHLPDA